MSAIFQGNAVTENTFLTFGNGLQYGEYVLTQVIKIGEHFI